MVKNCPVGESEWQDILLKLLQQEHQPDITATATVQGAKSIGIVIRKASLGITVSRDEEPDCLPFQPAT